MKHSKSIKAGKRGSKEKKPSDMHFRRVSTTFFLTFSGFSKFLNRNITKQQLRDFLLNDLSSRKINPIKHLICEQMYDTGEPHFHAILIYPKRKQILDPHHYDFHDIHPNIQTMRNMKAALQYVYKQDPNPLTNMDIEQQRRISRAKDSSSLYQLLQEQMKKDPFNFDVYTYCVNHDISRQIYKASYTKAIHLLKKIQQAYCNKLLSSIPGIKHISRALIEAKLTPSELELYDSWSGYQTIVDYLNQIPTYRYTRPPKTPNLLITGPSSIGKTALVYQQYPESHHNPLNKYCSVYPMGMKDWFPSYKSQVYDVIFWNQAKLTSYSYDIILQLLDGSPVMLPSKGSSHKKIDNPLVIMTSNMTLNEMIRQKFRTNPSYIPMSQQNLSVRITNVVVPRGFDLFLIQKLLSPSN